MDDWLHNLPGQLAYRAVEALLRLCAAWAWQKLKRLEGHYTKNIRVTIGDVVSVSDVTIAVQ